MDPGAHTDGPDKTLGSPQKVHGSSLPLSQQYYHLQIKNNNNYIMVVVFLLIHSNYIVIKVLTFT